MAEIDQPRPRLAGLAREPAGSQEPVKYRVHGIETQWPQLCREEQMIVIHNDSATFNQIPFQCRQRCGMDRYQATFMKFGLTNHQAVCGDVLET